ncbi:STAS-like domain-containing protein [Pseudomonas monteilii]|uniref:STAS-like domain-containing protein n=1 Tax=Pseudomonas monteilii TaxID=76759 RepID=UPI003D9605F9
MASKVIDIKAFSKAPYGRYPSDGPDSGQRFREEYLLPAFQDESVTEVVVNLDSVSNGYEYGSSFLEEAFGGLVRSEGLAAEDVLRKLKVQTKFADYVSEIEIYIRKAR